MLVALIAVLALAVPAPDQTKLTAKPGGKMSIDYGSPTWREGMDAQLQSGQTWRLGQNDPTTWTTAGGLVFEDAVLFPGSYHLAAGPKGGDTWELIFHHDGSFFQGKTEEERATLKETEVGKKDIAKRLVIELGADKKSKDTYEFVATFGARRMVGQFQAPKAKVAKAKAGKNGFELTWLVRTDLGTLAEKIDSEPTLIASIEVKDREKPLRVYLTGGETPELMLAEAGEKPGRGGIKGQRGDVEKPGTEVDVEVKSGDNAELVVTVAGHSYHFEIPPESVAPPGKS